MIDYESFNKIRKKYKNRIILFFLIIVAAVGVIAFLADRGSLRVLIAGGIIIIVMVIAILLNIRIYEGIYYKEVIYPFLKNLGVEYEPNEGIDEELVKSSGLFEDYDKFESSSLVKGDGFIMANVKLYKEDYDSEEDEMYKKIFDGSFLMFKSERFVRFPFLIDNNSFHLSDIFPIFINPNRIKLDDDEFERYFDVYGGDEIEVRKILTHEIMKKLIKLKQSVNFSKILFSKNFRFSTFENIAPVSYPGVFKEVNEDVVLNSLKGVLRGLYMIKFFKENNL